MWILLQMANMTVSPGVIAVTDVSLDHRTPKIDTIHVDANRRRDEPPI